MTQQEKLEGQIMDAIRRNPRRDHEAEEIQIDLSAPPKFIMPPAAVLLALNALVSRGELVQRTWNGEQIVYGLPDAVVAAAA